MNKKLARCGLLGVVSVLLVLPACGGSGATKKRADGGDGSIGSGDGVSRDGVGGGTGGMGAGGTGGAGGTAGTGGAPGDGAAGSPGDGPREGGAGAGGTGGTAPGDGAAGGAGGTGMGGAGGTGADGGAAGMGGTGVGDAGVGDTSGTVIDAASGGDVPTPEPDGMGAGDAPVSTVDAAEDAAAPADDAADAAVVMVDAAEIDAPEIDAAEIDAPVPMFDAPEIDAAEDAPVVMIDAPEIDAPVPMFDAPEIDAPDIDAAVPIDAPDIDAAVPMVDAPVDMPVPVDMMPAQMIQLNDLSPTAVSRRFASTVDLMGSLFMSGATVRLTSCTMMGTMFTFTPTVSSSTNGRILIPADVSRPQGLYSVTWINPDTMSDTLDCALRIVDVPPPTVTNVIPATAWQGSPGDGINSDATVEITGTGFMPTPRVRLRSVADPTKYYDAVSVVWISSTRLSVVMPSETLRMPIGDYHVIVENPNQLTGQWFTDAGMTMPGIFKITGTPPPDITSIDPVRCPNSSPTPPCPNLTANGTNIQPGAKLSLLISPSASCASGWTKTTTTVGTECVAASATVTGTTQITANTTGFGQGIYPVKVTNPDGQFDVFYSFAVTSSATAHLQGPFSPVAGVTLLEGRWRHGADYVFDDFGGTFMYVAGGQKMVSDAPLDSVEFSSASRVGDLSAFQQSIQWKPATDPTNPRGVNRLTTARTGLTMVHVGPWLYAIGGASSNTNTASTVGALTSVERARLLGYESMPQRKIISANGTIGLPKGTWFYRVSAVSSEGESLPSLPMQILGGRGQITVCWGAPPLFGSYTYNVYRSVAADGRAFTERLLASEVPGPCYVDDGFGVNQPAPGRLSGTDVPAPAGQPGLAVGSWTYRVSATVNGTETLAGYPATVAVASAGHGVQLSWDAIFGATYNLYRVPTVNGATGTEVLLVSGLTSPSYLDGGGVAPGAQKPKDGIAPLPVGSITRWALAPQQGGGTATLALAREGADAVVVSTTDTSAQKHTWIFVGGGRSDNRTNVNYAEGDGADNNHHKTIERTEVFSDGTLSAFAIEAQKFNQPRAFFALLTTQGSDQIPAPPPPKEPPCDDLDGDGYYACSCFKPLASCPAGDKTAACAPDCNDLDSSVNPSAPEICGDGKDQNCDGNACGGGTCTACGGSDLPCPVGVDAGVDATPPPADAAVPVMPPGCTMKDDDGDGYYWCGCFTPAGGCTPDNSSNVCAADCCDKPGDPGCPAAVTTLAGARSINPGNPEIQCDGVDNNCGFEKFNEDVPVFTCGQGTELCMPASERRPARASRFEGLATPVSGPVGANDGLARLGGNKLLGESALRFRGAGSGDQFPTLASHTTAITWLLACQGDDKYTTSGNAGLTNFEACRINQDTGNLEECSPTLPGQLWVKQNETLPGGQQTHAHDATLFFGFVFPFKGVANEVPGGLPTPSGSSAYRFPVTDAVSDPATFVGPRQSSTADFSVARAYYQLLRFNSQLFVIGGANESGVLSSIERRGQ